MKRLAGLRPLYSYTDYRAYLADWFESRKKLDPSMTHRAFCARADIGGSAYLCRVLNGTRKLNDAYVERFARALDLSPKEAFYFEVMVKFCNARRPAEKEKYLREMMAIRDASTAYRFEDRKLRFYEKWYYPIIRELVTCVEATDYNLLASMVIPRITPAQAKGAVHFLEENGFLKRDDSGSFVQSDPLITTGDEVSSTMVRKYHRTTLEHTSRLLDTIPPTQRDVSSLMLNVSSATYERLREEIRHFRKKLLEIAAEDASPSEKVCFVGLQLMPRSKSAARRRRS